MTAARNHRDLHRRNDGQTSHDHVSGSTLARPTVPRSRAAGLWIAAVAFALVLLLLLIFVLENGQRAEVSFFCAHGHLPLLVALPGTARIVQLRMLGHRRSARACTRAAAGPGVPSSDDTSGQQTHSWRPNSADRRNTRLAEFGKPTSQVPPPVPA